MDSLFVTNVPDISKWGVLERYKYDLPRPHLCRTLRITVQPGMKRYGDNVHQMARSIASARLGKEKLELWEAASSGTKKPSALELEPIARALARGICRKGCNYLGGDPKCNDDHFKGHMIEVLLYCLRTYLSGQGMAEILVFEPPRPKARSADGGIDLLEVGKLSSGYYFQVWECKGTDDSVGTALSSAARQLCDHNGTAYQSFMEAHRSLQENSIVRSNENIAKFVSAMIRMFYDTVPHESKRIGAVVGSGSNYQASFAAGFAAKVGDSIANKHPHCQAAFVTIADFPRFREDVFKELWNIF